MSGKDSYKDIDEEALSFEDTSNISLNQLLLVVKSKEPLSGFPLEVESVKLEHHTPSI